MRLVEFLDLIAFSFLIVLYGLDTGLNSLQLDNLNIT